MREMGDIVMLRLTRILLATTLLSALATAPVFAQKAAPDNYEQTATAEAAANTKPGLRNTPAKSFQVPADEVSPQMQALIGNPFPPHMNADPKNAAEWHALIDARTAVAMQALPALREKMGVTVEPAVMGGVKVFIVTPKTILPANKDRLLVHLHGGGYVFGPGEAATPEAILLAGFGGFKVISVDYRMPPDFPYPAAMDDAMAVWKEAIKLADPRKMAVFGTSTGGAMTLALVLRAKAEGVALPAAMAPGTPWADLDNIGDTYTSNEWVDNVLVTWNGWLGRAAKIYANGTSFKNPQISPIYGDFSGLPPAILTSGTRDLFLSNTVRTHRKLRRAGVDAELNVYEGQSHAQYGFDANAPETKEAFTDIARFFDAHLAK